METVPIKNSGDVDLMRESGRLLAEVFFDLDRFVAPGVTTMQINDRVEDFIINTLNARPASIGQYDYEYAINASPNDVVCHGVPNAHKRLLSRDIVNIDITLEKNGFIADSSKMYVMPNAGPQAVRLVEAAYRAMVNGIKCVKPAACLGDIGYAIQSYAEALGYNVVRDYCGHGIGHAMHEPPQVLHVGKKGEGLVLEPGMTFTIEPMLNQGGFKTRTKKDGWTVVTKDKKLSAQWEHTVLVTESGYEVLTRRQGEVI